MTFVNFFLIKMCTHVFKVYIFFILFFLLFYNIDLI